MVRTYTNTYTWLMNYRRVCNNRLRRVSSTLSLTLNLFFWDRRVNGLWNVPRCTPVKHRVTVIKIATKLSRRPRVLCLKISASMMVCCCCFLSSFVERICGYSRRHIIDLYCSIWHDIVPPRPSANATFFPLFSR